jgi:hypothetical protein
MLLAFYIYYSRTDCNVLIGEGLFSFKRALAKVYPTVQIGFWFEHFKGEHLMILLKGVDDVPGVEKIINATFSEFLNQRPSTKSENNPGQEFNLFMDYPNNYLTFNNHHFSKEELEERSAFVTPNTASFIDLILKLYRTKVISGPDQSMLIGYDLFYRILSHLTMHEFLDGVIRQAMVAFNYAESQAMLTPMQREAKQLYEQFLPDLNGVAKEYVIDDFDAEWVPLLDKLMPTTADPDTELSIRNLSDLCIYLGTCLGLGPVTTIYALFWTQFKK